MAQEQVQHQVTPPAMGAEEQEEEVLPEVDERNVPEAKASDNISVEEQKRLEELATKQVEALLESIGKEEELTTVASITRVGSKIQRTVSTDFELLEERMSVLFSGREQADSDAKIAENIAQLRKVLGRIHPTAVKRSLLYKVAGLIPFIGKRFLVKFLEDVALQQESVRDFVNYLEESLLEGQGILHYNNAQLAVMRNRTVIPLQRAVQSNAYLAELLMKKFAEAVQHIKDPKKKAALRNALARVSRRAMTLRTMDNALEQYKVGIHMRYEANELLAELISELVDLGRPLVSIGLALYNVRQQHVRVRQMAEAVSTSLTNMLVENARMTSEDAEAIGSLYTNPIIPVEKLEEAITQWMQAMDKLDRAKAEAIANAPILIERLKRATEELRTRSEGPQSQEVESLEAVELPTRPSEGVERPKIG